MVRLRHHAADEGPAVDVAPNVACPDLQAAANTKPHADDVLATMEDGEQLSRAEAFSALSALVVPPDALLQLLLADPAAAGKRNSAGATLQQEALAAAAAMFGAQGVALQQSIEPHQRATPNQLIGVASTCCFADISEVQLACALSDRLCPELLFFCVSVGNPFSSDEGVASMYLYLHFKQFLKFYNSPGHDRAMLDAACGHVQVC
jgi:hypothetical protein